MKLGDVLKFLRKGKHVTAQKPDLRQTFGLDEGSDRGRCPAPRECRVALSEGHPENPASTKLTERYFRMLSPVCSGRQALSTSRSRMAPAIAGLPIMADKTSRDTCPCNSRLENRC